VTDADITLHQAAEQLGVHYMTVYRYVRLGMLPAHKDGAVWRVKAADLAGFERLPAESSTLSRGGRRRSAPWADRFEARLLEGDGGGAWSVIEAAMAAGTGLDEVYLEVMTPALRSIGERWASEEIDVAAEHRASGIVMRTIGRLGPRFARRGRSRGTVVFGTPPGERHSLPLAMLSDLVRAGGFEVFDLGCDLPPDEFAGVARQASRLVAVGVSATAPEGLAAAAATVAALKAQLGPDLPVLLGGGAIRDAGHAASLGADWYAADGPSVVALLDRLVQSRAG
jgi:excisionase family DNA binding protein